MSSHEKLKILLAYEAIATYPEQLRWWMGFSFGDSSGYLAKDLMLFMQLVFRNDLSCSLWVGPSPDLFLFGYMVLVIEHHSYHAITHRLWTNRILSFFLFRYMVVVIEHHLYHGISSSTLDQ
jgi:hypothetical protein